VCPCPSGQIRNEIVDRVQEKRVSTTPDLHRSVSSSLSSRVCMCASRIAAPRDRYKGGGDAEVPKKKRIKKYRRNSGIENKTAEPITEKKKNKVKQQAGVKANAHSSRRDMTAGPSHGTWPTSAVAAERQVPTKFWPPTT
jgi:hypothetical protein